MKHNHVPPGGKAYLYGYETYDMLYTVGPLHEVKQTLATPLSVATPPETEMTCETINLIKTLKDKPTPWLVGEIYWFRHPVTPHGFISCNGALVPHANTHYPELWNFLQSDVGVELCKTEEEWQALTVREWYRTTNLSAGTTTPVTFFGIGGAPYFVLDQEKKTIRVPDVRGMSMETVGGAAYTTTEIVPSEEAGGEDQTVTKTHYLGVGDCDGARMRNITGSLYYQWFIYKNFSPTSHVYGVWRATVSGTTTRDLMDGTTNTYYSLGINTAYCAPDTRVNTPNAKQTASPKTLAMNACIFAGYN